MKFCPLLFLTVVLYMFCSCQYGSSTTTDKDGKDSDSLVVHIAILPVEECNPFSKAMRCGVFDSLGIEVQLDTFTSAMDADTAFVNGKVHLLVSDAIKAKYLQTLITDDTVRSVITDTLHLYMMTAKDSKIKSIHNLKERIIAVTRNSAVDCFADKTTDKAKIGRDYLNRPQINDIALRAKMLNLNQFDGAILPEPFASQCERQGAYRIASFKEPMMRVLVTEKTYKKYKKTIDKIKEAYSLTTHGKQ